MSNEHTCNNCDVELDGLMNYCFNCGEKQKIPNTEELKCKKCKRPVHYSFNHCYECGEDLNPDGRNQPKVKITGYELKFKCDDCRGKIQEYMSYCPWCGEKQLWENKYGDEYCEPCERNISGKWHYCVYCGDLIDRSDPGSWARRNGYLRPYSALVEMPDEFRENMRKTLNFNWAEKSKSDQEFQAKELLDCDLKGIIARFNNTVQHIVPFSGNISWRGILERILSELKIKYQAHLGEKEFESLLLENVVKRNIKNTPKEIIKIKNYLKYTNDVPTSIILSLANIDSIVAELFGSVTKPGYSAVLSICIWLHKSKLE